MAQGSFTNCSHSNPVLTFSSARPLDYFARHGPKEASVEQFEQALELLLRGNSINFKNPSRYVKSCFAYLNDI